MVNTKGIILETLKNYELSKRSFEKIDIYIAEFGSNSIIIHVGWKLFKLKISQLIQLF